MSAGHAPLAIPTFDDVLEARRVIGRHLRPTPLHRYGGLSALVGADVLVKHENHQPVGAFKVRGGVNLVEHLGTEERARGLIAASTGNHGQSIAYAARLFGARAVVCVPEGANESKVAAMRALGAEIVVHGRDFDEAREHCEELAATGGFRYVHSGDEPLLIAGVATHTLEILEDEPEVDVIIVPVGGGSGAAGACIAAKAIKPQAEVIGVQSAAAPAAHRSWQTRSLIAGERMETAAEGLATRVPFALPQRILWDKLDDFLLVSEDELRAATLLMIEHTRNLVEGAGAAPLAAALKLRDRLHDRRVAGVDCPERLDQKDRGTFGAFRTVLDPARDDEQVARFEDHVAVAQLDREPSFDDIEEVVGVGMAVPDELPLRLHHHHLVVVERADDARAPRLVEACECRRQVRLVLHAAPFVRTPDAPPMRCRQAATT